MKKLLIIITIIASCFITAIAQESIIDDLKSKLENEFLIGNYHEGQKFIIAIPPNGRESGWGQSKIRLSIASKTNANININIMGTNHKKTVKAGEVLYLDDNVGISATTTECRTPNTNMDKTITIEADMPISVYVLNSQSYSADMYKAIPVEFWGKEYRHCSYYDHSYSTYYKYSGGFLVLGSEDGTKVQIELKGRSNTNDGHLKNDPSKTIGDEFSFTLHEGEVYQIEGNGETNAAYDLSGTKISADKPIGVISYHTNAVIPGLANSSMGKHLSEMLPPVESMGKSYASLAMERNGSKKGDLFRMIATEDNTNVSFKWYDFESKQLIGSKTVFLSKAGNFEDYSSVMSISESDKSITGISVFEADKPIQLMQYSYSRAWDNSGFDSFMWLVPPLNQYAKHAVIQAPDLDGASENYLHLLVKADPEDKQLDGLKSVKLDGQYLDQIYPTLLSNKVPGTDLYWAQIQIATGHHEIEGDGTVEFGAYVQSKSSFVNYGSPAIMASKPQNTADTMAPKISFLNDIPYPTKWKIRIEENRSYPGEEEGFHYTDTKVWYKPITLIDSSSEFMSTNFKEPYTDFEWKYEGHDDYIVNLEVKDSSKYAETNFYVADYVGNISIANVKYFPNLLSLSNPQAIDFGAIPVKNEKINKLTFRNSSDIDYNIKNISLSGGQIFVLQNVDEVESLKKDESFDLEIVYSPKSIATEDKAVLTIETDNLTHTWTIKGSAFSDEEILDFEGKMLDFGTITINESKDKSLNIKNNGQTEIDIQTIQMKEGTIFNTSDEHNSSKLAAGNSLELTVSYSPKAKSDLDRDTIVVTTSILTYSYPVRGKADDDISVFENAAKLISISPNPLHDNAKITVKIESTSHLKAKLFDVKGQLVKDLYDAICNKGEINFDLDASDIASGIYNLIIEFDNSKFITPLIISK